MKFTSEIFVPNSLLKIPTLVKIRIEFQNAKITLEIKINQPVVNAFVLFVPWMIYKSKDIVQSFCKFFQLMMIIKELMNGRKLLMLSSGSCLLVRIVK